MRLLYPKRMGKDILETALCLKGCYVLLYRFVKEAPQVKNPAVREVLYRQIYFTGIEALGPMTVRGVLIGIVIITQVTAIVGMNAVLTGKILVWAVVRELGPLFAAIIIIARSSTAVASELGSMQVNRELDYLRVMGISPFGYLIVPRVAGITISVFTLTFYFQIITIAGGLFASSVLMDIPFGHHVNGVSSALAFGEVAISLLKSAMFGLVIAVVSCYDGLRVRASITEVPQMTTSAVMQSIFLVLLCDGAITFVSSL